MRTVVLALALTAAASSSSERSAHRVVETAVARMGGADALRQVSAMRLEWVGYRNLLEQSERPDGPWIPSIEKVVEVWDVPGRRWSQTAQATVAEMDFTLRNVVADGVAANQFGERWLPAGPGDVDAALEWMSLSPQEVLRSALDASDLRSERGREFQGVPHDVVAWGTGENARRLLVNRETGFATAVETLRAYPDDQYWQIWGDVPTRVSWSYWDLFPGGLFYPRQWDVERGGRPWRSLTITRLQPLAANALGDEFRIPQEARGALRGGPSQKLGDPKRSAVELSPGVVYVPGSWGVVLVRQDDGVVILEAPISAAFSAQVLDEAKRRFPGVPVKAAVTTSDSWPHFGGIREYAARGIPIYLLDHNVPQIRRALDSPHRFHPDALAKNPKAAILEPVASRTVLGKGPNRIELYPVRGETGERMMLAFLPETGLLWASDLFQAGRDGPPEYVWEILEAARREKLEVKTVVAMHSDPTPWTKLVEIVETARKPQ